jgi:NAD(P)-dependent dehydrogenase (short-subunit alcohol dehydrogenase family)
VATEGAGSKLWATPQVEQRLLAGIPAGRIGRPEEIAQAAAFLVSPYADYINGEALTMDGGEWLSHGPLVYQPQA